MNEQPFFMGFFSGALGTAVLFGLAFTAWERFERIRTLRLIRRAQERFEADDAALRRTALKAGRCR